MDLIMIAFLSIVVGIILVSVGLSFISASMESLDFTDSYGTTTPYDYYRNPLHYLDSKYFHYRPKGSVIVSKAQWAEIEKNIGVQIIKAKDAGQKIGYKRAIVEIQDKVKEEKTKTFPSSPYAVLDVTSTTPMAEVEEKYKHLLQIYNPNVFVTLDKAFIELAEIRTAQIVRAWDQISLGVVKSIDGGLY